MQQLLTNIFLPLSKESHILKKSFLPFFHLTILLVSFVYSISYIYRGYTIALIITAITAIGAITLFLLRNKISHTVNANITIFLYSICLFFITFLAGGPLSPSAFWLPVILMTAVTLVSIPNALVWYFITFIGEMILILLFKNYPAYFIEANKVFVSYNSFMSSQIILTTIFGGFAIYAEFQREISQRKLNKLNKELERQSLFTELAQVSAGIAHEINNPLQIIKAHLFLLEKKRSKDPQQSFQIIRQQIDRSSEIINNLKEISNLSSIDEQDILDPKHEITNILTLYSTKAKLREIKIIFNSKPTSIIKFNRSHFHQILTNLLNNAFDHLKEEPVLERWINIEVYDDNTTCTILFSNGGSRISPDIEDKIFTPFFTSKAPNEGTGLGLSISRSLAQKNGGELMIDSEKEYTTFKLITILAAT